MLVIAILLCLGGSSALYSSDSDIIDLTPKNFDDLVLKGDEIWFVEFFTSDCKQCKSLAPNYEKVATALKGMIRVAAVDAEKHKSLGERYDVKTFPTIKIFGVDKENPKSYKGDRTVQGLLEGALKAAKEKVKASLDGRNNKPKKDVIELIDPNFDKIVLQSEDMWLVEFYAPWCGHCKNLAPEWAKAASELKGRVKLGAIDATINIENARKYGVEGYPTIKYFPAGKKTSSSSLDYDGGRSSAEIVAWALEKLAEDVPPADVSEIVDKTAFETACNGKPLCLVAFLPHILDCQSKCRNNYLKILRELSDRYKKKSWGWGWSEAGAQPELEMAVEVGGFGYPAMAVVNVKKMKFSVLRGAFAKEGIDEFLKDVINGRTNTATLKGLVLPKIVKVDQWDGKDRQISQEQEIKLEQKQEL